MKLRPVKRNVPPPAPAVPPKKERKKNNNTLPLDEYKPIYEPFRFLVSDRPSRRDPESRVKHYLEIKVIRINDEEGLPVCQVSTYQESNFYTGYLKGKSITLPVSQLATLVEALSDAEDQCERDGLMEEYE